MTLCGDIHQTALNQGGGTVTFTCPETGAKITGFAGVGGTFMPTQIVPGPLGGVPTLVTSVGSPPFAGAKPK